MGTRLTEVLGVDLPVMLAGMGGVSYGELAAAVSNAGGYGCLGASTMSSEQLASEMALTASLTSRPFGVDLLTAFPDSLDENVEIIIDGGATSLVAGLGIPTRVIDRCKAQGLLVMSMCGKVDHARRAVDAGCDVVIAQGTEAGGHTGSVATFPLVPQIVDAVGAQVPVVAAGGIADGRGLVAALALGADGVWMGTRFIASTEARALPGFREAILATTDDRTVISRAYSGKPMRVARNVVTDYFDEHRDELQPFPAQLLDSLHAGRFHLGAGPDAQGIDPEREGYPMGQIAGSIHDVRPAGDIVSSILNEARAVMSRLEGLSI